MLSPRFNITAYNHVTNARLHLFTWCRGADAGIARAKSEAIDNGMEKYLSDYQAEQIKE